MITAEEACVFRIDEIRWFPWNRWYLQNQLSNYNRCSCMFEYFVKNIIQFYLTAWPSPSSQGSSIFLLPASATSPTARPTSTSWVPSLSESSCLQSTPSYHKSSCSAPITYLESRPRCSTSPIFLYTLLGTASLSGSTALSFRPCIGIGRIFIELCAGGLT